MPPVGNPARLSDFGGFLSPDQAAPIFQQAQRVSVVQQLAQKIPLGINGEKIPVFTGKPTAGWVGEAGKKPTTAGAVALRYIMPHKLAAIIVASAEVIRANPANYITQMRGDMAEAFATAFDIAALHNTNSPFGDTQGDVTYPNYVDATALDDVELGGSVGADGTGGTYVQIVSGLRELVASGKKLRGFAFDDYAEPLLLDSVDKNGRPLWIASPNMNQTVNNIQSGTVIGRPSRMAEGVGTGFDDGDIIGYGGDWTQAAWGVVGGITYDVSTETSVTLDLDGSGPQLVSLWEHNLVAIRAEAEYGFVINDKDAFVKYVIAA